VQRAFALAVARRLSSEAVDAWDQVAKFGRFVKDDGEGPKEAVFNLEHLGEFIDNFAGQVNPLWADTNHDFGDALARYDALSLVVGGVPIRTRRGAVRSREPSAAGSAPTCPSPTSSAAHRNVGVDGPRESPFSWSIGGPSRRAEACVRVWRIDRPFRVFPSVAC
jgi:hypothetical protein